MQGLGHKYHWGDIIQFTSTIFLKVNVDLKKTTTSSNGDK